MFNRWNVADTLVSSVDHLRGNEFFVDLWSFQSSNCCCHMSATLLNIPDVSSSNRFKEETLARFQVWKLQQVSEAAEANS